MHSLNFSTVFLHWVINSLKHWQYFGQINSNYLSYLTAKYGVPQGSALGPIFLNRCEGNMSSITPNSNCTQYANDSVIHRKL